MKDSVYCIVCSNQTNVSKGRKKKVMKRGAFTCFNLSNLATWNASLNQNCTASKITAYNST